MLTKPLEAYPPAEIARLVESVGVKKARMPIGQTLALGLLAGAFIALGAMFFTLVMTDGSLGLGPGRLLGGVAFSLGLVLVVIGGAELFTGNSLIVMAWADHRISAGELLRNWLLVYVANFAGAVSMALMAHWSGVLALGDDAISATAIGIAQAKVALDFQSAFWRGVLCNILVCLAIWLSFAAHSVSGKIIAIVFPISAFVALGFEHSIANMYLIPIAMLIGDSGISVGDVAANLLPVTLGNVIGGGVLVALTYWLIYIRPSDST